MEGSGALQSSLVRMPCWWAADAEPVLCQRCAGARHQRVTPRQLPSSLG